eukprot:3866478-Amphidinium_carterae.2
MCSSFSVWTRLLHAGMQRCPDTTSQALSDRLPPPPGFFDPCCQRRPLCHECVQSHPRQLGSPFVSKRLVSGSSNLSIVPLGFTSAVRMPLLAWGWLVAVMHTQPSVQEAGFAEAGLPHHDMMN